MAALKFLIAYVGLLNAEIGEILKGYNLSIQDVLKDKNKAFKALRKQEKEHLGYLLDLLDFFVKSTQELNALSFKSEAVSLAKKIDEDGKLLLDLTEQDEYILLISALYIAYKMPHESLSLKLLAEKAERLFDEAVSIFGKVHGAEVVRNSYKVGQTIVDYFESGKKIHFSIKKQRPKWAKRSK